MWQAGRLRYTIILSQVNGINSSNEGSDFTISPSEQTIVSSALPWLSEDAWPSTYIGVLSNGHPETKDEKLIGMLILPFSIDQLLTNYISWSVTQRKLAILIKFYIKAK